MMDTFRYWLALLVVLTLPPMLLFWYLIHPWVEFWRRQGVRRTYAAMAVVQVLGITGMSLLREPLLAVDFHTQPLLVALGAGCLATAGWLRVRLHKQVDNLFFLGLPELAPERHPQLLLTEGLYARVRHPRYCQLTLALIGYALIANYPAVYAAVLLWLIALFGIVALEERELCLRYGGKYVEYMRRTPRFIPRWR